MGKIDYIQILSFSTVQGLNITHLILLLCPDAQDYAHAGHGVSPLRVPAPAHADPNGTVVFLLLLAHNVSTCAAV